jgi:hypothetical protein
MGSPNQGQRNIDGLRQFTIADLGQEIFQARNTPWKFLALFNHVKAERLRP